MQHDGRTPAAIHLKRCRAWCTLNSPWGIGLPLQHSTNTTTTTTHCCIIVLLTCNCNDRYGMAAIGTVSSCFPDRRGRHRRALCTRTRAHTYTVRTHHPTKHECKTECKTYQDSVCVWTCAKFLFFKKKYMLTCSVPLRRDVTHAFYHCIEKGLQGKVCQDNLQLCMQCFVFF